MSANADRISERAAIDRSLREAARVPTLLVATDFDGTVAPIVPNPEDARPLPEAIDALVSLAGMDRTETVAISGRGLAELRSLSGLPGRVHLIGSHGSETSDDLGSGLDEEQRALRERVEAALEEIASAHPGATIERKPAAAALHYRNANDVDEDALHRRILEEGPGAWEGVHAKPGKKVIELSVVDMNKGDALEALREKLGADAVVFFGDDVTDEDIFQRLREGDVGVKVGDGPTAAELRVGDPDDVAQWLATLVRYRRESVYGTMPGTTGE